MTSRPLREATIDLDAISSNVEALRRSAGTAHFLAVVKADGYGHGAVPAARAAMEGGADWLGVIDSAEARVLRSAGIGSPILTWLHGPLEDFATAAEDGIDVGVNSLAELERAVSAGVRNIQVKVDTGLSRNGAVEGSWEELFARARSLERTAGAHIRGIFSHLANAGTESDDAQRSAFDRAVAVAASVGIAPEVVHLSATLGALAGPDARCNLVRVGLGCYGLSPLDGVSAHSLGLTPAMELSAEVVSVKRVPAGAGVSYGHRYRTDRDTTLALIPLGYADGIPRQASGLGPVTINQSRFTVAGVVAMDQIIVDVGDAEVSAGDRAVVFGDPELGAPSADEWAVAAGTINYEIVSRLGHRVERRYVGGVA